MTNATLNTATTVDCSIYFLWLVVLPYRSSLTTLSTSCLIDICFRKRRRTFIALIKIAVAHNGNWMYRKLIMTSSSDDRDVTEQDCRHISEQNGILTVAFSISVYRANKEVYKNWLKR